MDTETAGYQSEDQLYLWGQVYDSTEGFYFVYESPDTRVHEEISFYIGTVVKWLAEARAIDIWQNKRPFQGRITYSKENDGANIRVGELNDGNGQRIVTITFDGGTVINAVISRNTFDYRDYPTIDIYTTEVIMQVYPEYMYFRSENVSFVQNSTNNIRNIIRELETMYKKSWDEFGISGLDVIKAYLGRIIGLFRVKK